MTDNLIEIEGLRYSRGDRTIFDGLTLTVPRGQITALMGPSGTGKTTLLRIIGGQIRPDAGRVIFDGRDVPSLSRRELFELRRNMGMLFQSSALYTDVSVFENVAFPLRVHTNLPDDMIRDLVLMKLNAVGLRGARDLMPAQLSGGMARRVAIARSMALDPQFIMYDEPFTGQDPIAMGVLVSLIRGLNESLTMTSLVVSHDIHETASIADQMYIIADGRVIGAGTPEALRVHTSTMVRQFMLGSPDGPVPFHYPAENFLDDVLGRLRTSCAPADRHHDAPAALRVGGERQRTALHAAPSDRPRGYGHLGRRHERQRSAPAADADGSQRIAAGSLA